MKHIVISLPSREDRRATFFAEFADAHKFEVAEGVLHPTPHVGCGLAHARSIQRAFETSPDIDAVLVLEDDARRRVAWADIAAVVAECRARVHEWDAVTLGSQIIPQQPLPEDVRVVSDSCFSFSHSLAITGCAAMLWARSVIPFLCKYEAKLRDTESAIPIDRVLFGGVWNVWGPVSNFSAPYDAQITMEGPAERDPPDTAPRVWMTRRQLVYQSVGDLSNNTGRVNLDLRAQDDRGYAALERKAAFLAKKAR